MSSSSESSDDEEEQQRIREAVLGVGTSSYQNGKSGNKIQADGGTSSQKIIHHLKTLSTNAKACPDVSNLKSNRPQDRNDEDDEPLLKTTPEFRAYVAKQLSKLLDRDLSDCLVERVWDKTAKDGSNPERGLKLFSDSQTWCQLETPEPVKTSQEQRKRKVRLSTSSSDSSEDESIKACVFSVADIEQENLRLAALEDRSGPHQLTVPVPGRVTQHQLTVTDPGKAAQHQLTTTDPQRLVSLTPSHSQKAHEENSASGTKKKKKRKKNKSTET